MTRRHAHSRPPLPPPSAPPAASPGPRHRRAVVVVPLLLACAAAPAWGGAGRPSPTAPEAPAAPAPGLALGERDGTVALTAQPDATGPGPGFASAGGTWPLAPRPRVVARFSAPQARWSAGHRGVDLAGRPGQPVVAARDGVVRHAGRLAGRGVVSVDHPDTTRTTYEPLLVEVSRGDTVRAGDRLGWLVTEGSHCAPAACLHWGWRRGEEYLDPLTLVGATPVRLLPLAGPPSGRAVGGSSVDPSASRGAAAAFVRHPWASARGDVQGHRQGWRPGWRGAGSQARGWAWR